MNKVLLVFIGLLTSPVIHANELHPSFPLLDRNGQLVMQTNEPFSGMQTCGECHDTAFIANSSDHLNEALCYAGKCPAVFLHNPSHNHMTQVYTINTTETDISERILAFLKENAE